jgi:hypothetical protein
MQYPLDPHDEHDPQDQHDQHDPAGVPETPDDQPEMEKARLENLELHLKIIAAGLAALLALVELGSAISSTIGS